MSTVGVYIGRFQPFHNGHKSVVDRMLAENPTNVLLFGSHGPRNTENPFNLEERKCLVLTGMDRSIYKGGYHLCMRGIADNPNDGIWAAVVQHEVSLFSNGAVRLYGAYSDASSFYLDLFPEWEKRLTKLEGYQVHATTIRLWLRNRDWTHIERHVPPGTFEYLKKLVEDEPDTCHRWLR